MEGKIIMWIYGVGIVVALAIIVFLIFRRIKIKKDENFEDRDN